MDSFAVLSLGVPTLADAPPMGERADVRDASFLRHLRQQLDRDSPEDLVGVPIEGAAKPLAADEATDEPAAALAQFLALLRQFAAENQPAAGGEWRLPDMGRDEIVLLAQGAGLSEERLAGLEDLLAAEGDGISLDGLLAFFQRRFSEVAMEQGQPVTIDETGLPLIQSILSRVGIDADAVARIGEAAVTGDDRLDLGRLIAGLQDITPQLVGGKAELSAFERRELLRLFERAGLADASSLAQTLAAEQEGGLQVDFQRFLSMLQQGYDALAAQRPAVDPLGFVERLEKMLADAGFAEKQPAWTPLLQNSLRAVYKELANMVDLATVEVGQAGESAAFAWDMTTDGGLPPLFAVDAAAAANGEGKGLSVTELLARLRQLGHDGGEEQDGALSAELNGLAGRHGRLGMAGEGGHQFSGVGESSSTAAAPHRPASRLEQSVLQQLHDGVLQGISQRKQHMVLKLHPPELGEVKVDIVVRHDQVAVSFAMENHRVKEILENNMQQFRDSLEQRGFTLGQCFVSVGQDNAGSGDDQWRTMLASLGDRVSSLGSAGRQQASSVLEQPVLRHWWAESGRGASISLMV